MRRLVLVLDLGVEQGDERGDLRLQIFSNFFGTLLGILAEVVKLVLLEAADEGALVLLEGDLGHQVDDSEGVDEANDVYFFAEPLTGLPMSLIPLDSPLVTESLRAKTAAALDEPGCQVFRVGVPVLASLHNSVEHHLLGFSLSLWSGISGVTSVAVVIVWVFSSLRRGWIYRPN